jgi:hypothetical protein
MTVYGDACRYQASVDSYDGLAQGALVGSLSCTKWTAATCYRGKHQLEACGLAYTYAEEEIFCAWYPVVQHTPVPSRRG